ncbi:hypothetical protein GCM10020358_56250 [Amorphoplanes nipponensis]
MLVDQPAHRLGDGAARAERADRRPGGEPVEHGPGARRRGEHGPPQLRAVGAQGRRLRVQVVGGTAQARRVRRGHLVDRTDDLQGVLGPVQQEPGPEPVDRHP